MRRIIVGTLFLLLAGCVSVSGPRHFVSPLTFDSPPTFTAAQQVYLPLIFVAPNKRGASLACGYEDMARLAREVQELGVSWVWNWGTQPPMFPGIESVPAITVGRSG